MSARTLFSLESEKYIWRYEYSQMKKKWKYFIPFYVVNY